MNYSGDAAEQVVRITLNGVELAAKITGNGAKHLAVMLYAALKNQSKTKGKTRLSSMLRSGKELRVFAVKDTELQCFCTEAKKYGVLYCVLRDKNANDGLTDIMVRAEDAAKINRIFERFNLATVDVAAVRSEAKLSKSEKVFTAENTLLNEHIKPSPGKGEPQSRNPIPKSPRSEPTSEYKENAEGDIGDRSKSRRSVKEELNSIRKEQEHRNPQSPDGILPPSPHFSNPKQKPSKKNGDITYAQAR